MDKSTKDNRSNQLNPNNGSYSKSLPSSYKYTPSDRSNKSNQMNSNNSTYFSSRKTHSTRK